MAANSRLIYPVPMRGRGDEGVVLITALAFLALFAMLGTSYVGYMSIEIDTSRYQVRELRARHLASAGIYASIGEVQRSIELGETPPGSLRLDIPVYSQKLFATSQTVDVVVEDECARINLNFAPREVLEAIGIERSAVRDLKRSLPREAVAYDSSQRWLLSNGDARVRGLSPAEGGAPFSSDLVTVHSADPLRPEAYLNLNGASPAVLAALLNMSLDDAKVLADQRPFASWQDVLDKSGRAPESFNVRSDIGAIDSMPNALALFSRCYRLTSSVALAVKGTRSRALRHTVDAVVYFAPDGSYDVRYWQETSGAGTETSGAGQETSGAAADGNDAGAKDEEPAGE